MQAVNRARRLPDPPRLIFSVAAGVYEFAGEVDDPEGIYGAGQWFPGSGTRAELGPPQDAFLAAYAAVTDQPVEYPGVQAAAAAVIAAHCARRAAFDGARAAVGAGHRAGHRDAVRRVPDRSGDRRPG